MMKLVLIELSGNLCWKFCLNYLCYQNDPFNWCSWESLCAYGNNPGNDPGTEARNSCLACTGPPWALSVILLEIIHP